MGEREAGDERQQAAGDFSSWLVQIRGAIGSGRTADVPCGGCTACCRGSQFVHIGPDETETLARIPSELLFPAPRLPRGHVLLGYDEKGHCPMLVDDRCSIYEHRPRTCRTYDCRIFPATGLDPDDGGAGGKAPIAEQARRWRFTFPTENDRREYEAVRAAATFLRRNPSLLPAGTVATNAPRLAVLALAIHEVFLRRDAATGTMTVTDPDPEAVREEIRRRAGPPS